MTEREALKLALEALENSVDLVVQDAYNAEQLYGNYPTRQGKVGGLKVLAEQHKQAITAIKEALAQPEHGWTPERIAGMARLKDAQDKRLAQPEQKPVAWRYKIVDCFGRPAWTLKTPKSDTRVLESQPLYTTPPQRKPLTDEEIKAMYIEKNWYEMAHAFTWGAAEVVARAIEAAHGIKGEA